MTPTLSYDILLESLSSHDLLVSYHLPYTKLPVGKLQTSSQHVQPGQIFLAYSGARTDSHQFIPEAIASGASVIVLDNPEHIPDGMPYILTTDARMTRAHLEALIYGNPQHHLSFVGITGTNGKTSTCWMLSQYLSARHIPHTLIGTLGIKLPDGSWIETGHTTPDPEVFYDALRKTRRQGGKWVVMEVSSHALSQGRLGEIRFSLCGFTSFSRDHLDFHDNLESYFAAKLQLFRHLKSDGKAYINSKIDTSWIPKNDVRFQTYGPGGDIDLAQYSPTPNGSTFTISQPGAATRRLVTPMFGIHTCENFLLAYLMGSTISPPNTISSDLIDAIAKPIPGRLEQVKAAKTSVNVFIDYAHTPDALEVVTRTLRGHCLGKLWLVFGCGGERDRGKRPLMGQVAGQYADHIIITSDNPRSEPPECIASEILSGCTSEKATIILDRRQAIRHTLAQAEKPDIVLIAGKGHERYQEVANQKLRFSDCDVVSEYFKGSDA